MITFLFFPTQYAIKKPTYEGQYLELYMIIPAVTADQLKSLGEDSPFGFLDPTPTWKLHSNQQCLGHQLPAESGGLQFSSIWTLSTQP